MDTARRRQKEKDDLRRRILDTARELFIAEGYDSVSMRKIADRIGYTPTTIYLHFRDKSELLYEVCEEGFRKLHDRIARAQKASPGPLEKLRNGLLAYVDFGLKNPHHYEVVFILPVKKVFHGPERSYERSMGREAFELLVSSVAECIEAGDIRRADVMTTAQTLWAGIHGITSLLITQKGFPFVKKNDLIASVVDTMIAGLKR